jgi:hypothetical protein
MSPFCPTVAIITDGPFFNSDAFYCSSQVSGSGSGAGIRIQIQDGKNDTQKRSKKIEISCFEVQDVL